MWEYSLTDFDESAEISRMKHFSNKLEMAFPEYFAHRGNAEKCRVACIYLELRENDKRIQLLRAKNQFLDDCMPFAAVSIDEKLDAMSR
jgi:uncharacterized protein YeeX (DUF496 family)